MLTSQGPDDLNDHVWLGDISPPASLSAIWGVKSLDWVLLDLKLQQPGQVSAAI